ncbi:MAG: flagellar M-ring protein FliF [bacterium]|nr:flagellar M-ring protein FliF [bacterium]MCM1375649.1 flagellar M-ring protein FliF [Muribaculum sp.]
MLDRLKEIWAKVLEWWNKFTSKQKTVIIAIVAVVVFAFAILIYVFSRPQYTRLMTCETATEAATVMETLEAAGIDCKLSDSGLNIDVNVDQISDANRALGSARLVSSRPNIKDVTDAGMSATQSDKALLAMDYKRQELEAAFKNFDSVASCHVILDLADQDGTLVAREQESFVYICLELNGTFTPDNAAAMARAAATAVGNATTSNIFIGDTAGNSLFSGDEEYTLTGSTISQIEAQNAAESYIRSKVKQALINTGQFDALDVAAFLKYDYSNYEETQHRYEAQAGRDEGLIGHQSLTESENMGGVSGPPGTDSNDEDEYLLDTGGTTSSSSSSSDTDHVLDEMIWKSITPAGIIDYDGSSLTVTARSINVVHEEIIESQGLLDVMSWEEYKANNNTSTRMEVDDDFYDAVATATGISRDRITIIAYRENVFFDKEGLNVNWTDILSIVMIVIILALLAFVILRSMVARKSSDQEEELSVENLLQSTPESELEDIEVESKSETRKLIEKFVDENPEAVANLLRNWLNEDWG